MKMFPETFLVIMTSFPPGATTVSLTAELVMLMGCMGYSVIVHIMTASWMRMVYLRTHERL